MDKVFGHYRVRFNPIQTGGSKVPVAQQMPSKLRKSKKIQKNNYKYKQPSYWSSPLIETTLQYKQPFNPIQTGG